MTSLTQKTKYALKALFYLARKDQQEPKSPALIADIASSENIPRKFLEVILLELKHNGVLQSRKGKGGGYWLSKAPEELYVGPIIRIFEGPLAPILCVSKRHYQPCSDCEDVEHCSVRQVMFKVKLAILDVLDKTSLRDVLSSSESPIILS